MQKSYLKKSITTELAQEMINIAYKKSIELGSQMSIAIVDESGNLKAFLRMEDASLLSIGIAQNKAYSAAANGKGLSTQELFEYSQKSPAASVGIPHLEKVTVLGGGFAIRADSCVIGGIGASGGSTEQDILVAKAALSILDE